ncbi:MAG: threonine synthase [Chloroflexi bacterium]|nr:threonine synthase [Chloroflexota bacterium]
MTFLSHIECPECASRYAPDRPATVCACGSPLVCRYDLAGIARAASKEGLRARAASMWRYREFLPVVNPANVVTLGEGFTPLLRVERLGHEIGIDELLIKDEGANPTGTFKARGASAGVTRAKELGIGKLALLSWGSAASAWSVYGARAGLEVFVVMSVEAPTTVRNECRAAGAHVVIRKGPFIDLYQVVQDGVREHGWFPVTALFEPYRVEGKKTIGFELAEQLGWEIPDVIIHPTGGGVGLIATAKAFDELEAAGWIDGRRPRLVAAQSSGCAPLVEALERGEDDCALWRDPETIAVGLLVPKPIGARLVLRAIRHTQGAAVAVSDAEILRSMALVAKTEGLLIGPEGAAAIAVAAKMRQDGRLRRDERVVVINTSTGIRYPRLIGASLRPA